MAHSIPVILASSDISNISGRGNGVLTFIEEFTIKRLFNLLNGTRVKT